VNEMPVHDFIFNIVAGIVQTQHLLSLGTSFCVPES